jgi:hypothetical protein
MFYCELCNYSTDSRSKINFHHIVPRELMGSNNESNRIYLCPTCHSLIYVEGTSSGIHSIRCEKSIIIFGWFQSTSGRVLQYIKDGKEFFKNSKN